MMTSFLVCYRDCKSDLTQSLQPEEKTSFSDSRDFQEFFIANRLSCNFSDTQKENNIEKKIDAVLWHFFSIFLFSKFSGKRKINI